MCAEGRIAGVTKFGRAWAIPVDADKPKDNRIITGQRMKFLMQNKEVFDFDTWHPELVDEIIKTFFIGVIE